MIKKITAVLTCLLAAAGPVGAQQSARDAAVKWSTVTNDNSFSWIENLNIPDSAPAAKAVSKGDVGEDINKLLTVTKTVLKDSVAAPSKISEEVVAARDLVAGNDVLLVKQTSPQGKVSIQDGRDFVVILSPGKRAGVSLDGPELQEHVMSAAYALLNIPEQERDKLTFFTSQADLGNSRAGWLYYGKDSSKNWIWKHWYSAIRWWSDGSRVMFAIDKFPILNPDVDRSKVATAPPGSGLPRKFGK